VTGVRIVRVGIENFRSLEELECGFDDVTTFVGPNGAGKSTVLRALDWFFNGDKTWLSYKDMFAGAPAESRIRVRVDFDSLTDADRAALGSRYAPEGVDEFSVWKTWRDGEEKITGRAMAFPPFEEIRQAKGAAEKRTLYKALSDRPGAPELPPARSAAEIDEAMDQWERDNPEALSEAEVSDTYFFGFNGRGRLSSLFDYVFVSADLRADEQTSDGRDTVIGRILQFALDRSALNEEVDALTGKFADDYAALAESHLQQQLADVGQSLSEQVSEFATGRRVELSATPPVIKPQFPKIAVEVTDGSVSTSVGLQGHGLQRTLLLSALTVLSRAGREPDVPGGMFLAVEEPELFQHPTQARAFASVLRKVATEGSGTQVAYATHSPYFIEPNYFDQIRRVTNVKSSRAAQFSSTKITVASMDGVISELDGFIAPEKVQRRWSQACLKNLPEALFADAVILVEGDEDAAVLQGLGDRVNDLAVQGIAVASVGGKGNLHLPFVILRSLGIPSLMVADNDAGCRERMEKAGRSEDKIVEAEEKNKKDNRMLCRLVGVSETDYPVGGVSRNLAFVPDTLETLLSSELPGWDIARKQIIEEGRGVDGKNAATYELASRECRDELSGELSGILSLVTTARAA